MWLLKWLASLLGVPAVLGLACWWGFHHIEGLGEAKSAAALKADKQTIVGLEGVIADQNARVRALAAAGAAAAASRKKAGADGLAAVDKADQASQVASVGLRAAAGVTRLPDGPCTISEGLAAAKGL
jgi:hypothetical protein